MEDLSMQPTSGPIITERAQRWLNGELSIEEYWAQCHAEALPIAAAQVDRRLAQMAESRRLKRAEQIENVKTHVNTPIKTLGKKAFDGFSSFFSGESTK
jgi:hypothetical protein